MSDCPLVRLATNLKLLKQFEQTGQVAVHVSNWLHFFEVMAFISRDAAPLEIHCAFAGEYLVFSRTPIKRKANKEPTQSELFE